MCALNDKKQQHVINIVIEWFNSGSTCHQGYLIVYFYLDQVHSKRGVLIPIHISYNIPSN